MKVEHSIPRECKWWRKHAKKAEFALHDWFISQCIPQRQENNCASQAHHLTPLDVGYEIE